MHISTSLTLWPGQAVTSRLNQTRLAVNVFLAYFHWCQASSPVGWGHRCLSIPHCINMGCGQHTCVTPHMHCQLLFDWTKIDFLKSFLCEKLYKTLVMSVVLSQLGQWRLKVIITAFRFKDRVTYFEFLHDLVLYLFIYNWIFLWSVTFICVIQSVLDEANRITSWA